MGAVSAFQPRLVAKRISPPIPRFQHPADLKTDPR